MNTKLYLKKILSSNKLLILITIISSMIQAIASIGIALISKILIDQGIDSLLVNTIYLIIVIIILIIFYAINHYSQIKLQSKIEHNLRTDLFSNIFDKDYYIISKIHSGKLMNYLTSDINVVASNASSILPSCVLMSTRLVLAFIVLLILEWHLAIFLLSVGLVGFVIALLFRKRMKTLHKDVQEKDGASRSFMQEAIESNLVIKSFLGEEVVDSKNTHLQEEVFKSKIKRAKFSVSINSLLNLVFQGTYALTLVWAVYLVWTNEVGYGTLVALIQLVNQIQGPMMNLSGIVPKYYQMMASIERILEVKNLESELKVKDDKVEDFETIKFEDFNFSYDNFNVIKDSNLIINKGDFVLIKGISGIGKSTFLKLLLGILKPTSGSAYIENGDSRTCLSKTTRTLFSYVPQGNFIFSGTIKENLTFFNKDVKDDEINKALELSSSNSFIQNLENGLNTYIGEKGLGLSEGQIQRLAIARALLSNRKILLLDEATSALDRNTELEVLNNLKSLKDVTCIIVTHKDASKFICNKELEFNNNVITIKELHDVN